MPLRRTVWACWEERALGLAVEEAEIRAVAYSEAKPGQRRRRRAGACGRRSEEGGAAEGGKGGMLGLRLREQEGQRKKRERGKEIYRAESMCSQ